MSYVDNPFQSPVILSLCTGMRGLERGLHRAIGDFTVAAYVEIEAFIIYNLVRQMEQGVVAPAPVWSNLKTFPSHQFHRKIHGIIGGYPCQPFSVAGNQTGDQHESHLWPYIKESARIIQPRWLWFENVANHLNIGYQQVKSDLEELGYSVKEGIYSAIEAGASHRRERLFILAMADTNSNGSSIIPRGYSSESSQVETKEQRKERNEVFRERLRTVTRNSSTDVGNAEGSNKQRDFKQSRVEDMQVRESSTLLDHTISEGLQGHTGNVNREGRQSTGSARSIAPAGFPLGQGYEQYEWEEDRTTFAPLGCYVDGNEDRIDILDIKKIYETYTDNKISAIKELSELWDQTEQKENEWTVRRLLRFFKEEVLLSGLCRKVQDRGFTIAITRCEDLQRKEKDELRNMWLDKTIRSTSQGQEYFQQLRREFADTMCVLSYQITLAGRQETKTGSQEQTLQYLFSNYQDAWWNVPETLSEIQKIWEPLSNKECWRWQIERAYQGYRIELYGTLYGYNFQTDLLRMYGNGVVEQCAEVAFIDLLNKHINNLR